RAARVDVAEFLLDPGADLARRARQRRRDPGLQVFLLLAVHLAGAATGLETRQPFEAVLDEQAVPPAHWHAAPIDAPPIHPAPGWSGRRGQRETKSRRKSCPMTNPKIAPWQAVFRTIDESGYNVIALDENASCIPASAPVETGQLQCVSNDRMDRIPVLYMKGDEALAEDLRRVVRLDAQSLSRVERSETFLQFAQDILVHEITSSEIGSTFHGEHEALPDTTEYSLRANACFTERHGSFARRELPAGEMNHLPRTP